MPNPNINLTLTAIASPVGNVTDPPVRGWYDPSCNGFWRDAALVVPSALLLLYLGFQAKRNLKKLNHRRSYVMIAYYALLWFTALFNLAWALLQGWQCEPGKTVAFNLVSIFTECGMLALEVSIMAFLLQENYASGLEGLAHTFLVSGSIVAVNVLIQVVFTAIFIFGFGVPLFINVETTHHGKWSVLFFQTLVLSAIYCYILFVHYSKWRDKLPPRPSFYNYVVVMFIVNVLGLFAIALAGIGFSLGLWLYNFIIICRHSLYLPFLYVTFLADFFQEEDWLLDNAYYSEMKDAGFFDTDWD